LQPSCQIVSFVEMQESVKTESYDELDVGRVGKRQLFRRRWNG